MSSTSICCISEEKWVSNQSLKDFRVFKGYLSMSDVATLVEVFEIALQQVYTRNIKDVLVNPDRQFIFLIDESSTYNFDFYDFINNSYNGSTVVSCVNAKLVFPRSLSKGIYTGYYENYTVEEEDEEDGEGSTGFMDEEDILSITGTTSVYLYHSNSGTKIPISSNALVIGRSDKTADFVVKGNKNVSRNHCKIFKDGAICYIEDLRSVNGTYVNGSKVVNVAVELNVGDVILVADEEFTIM